IGVDAKLPTLTKHPKVAECICICLPISVSSSKKPVDWVTLSDNCFNLNTYILPLLLAGAD
ncbi:MAG: hypothetical protein ACYTXY_50925, partial [Nostoc sp.]